MAIFRQAVWVIFGIGWACCIAVGVRRVMRDDAKTDIAATPPLIRDESGRISQLVVYLHPRCPCSSATVDELAQLMTDCNGKLTGVVKMVRPPGVELGWEKSALWESAAAIPGVKVVVDDDGIDAKWMGAQTSGQAMLYDAQGRLLFTGGITSSRGHRGDNAGCDAIRSLVLDPTHSSMAVPVRTPVYGCRLFNESQSRVEKELE